MHSVFGYTTVLPVHTRYPPWALLAHFQEALRGSNCRPFSDGVTGVYTLTRIGAGRCLVSLLAGPVSGKCIAALSMEL